KQIGLARQDARRLPSRAGERLQALQVAPDGDEDEVIRSAWAFRAHAPGQKSGLGAHERHAYPQAQILVGLARAGLESRREDPDDHAARPFAIDLLVSPGVITESLTV